MPPNEYEAVPTNATDQPHRYPPLSSSSSPGRLLDALRAYNPFSPEHHAGSHSLKSKRIATTVKYLGSAFVALGILHFVFIGAFPKSAYTAAFRSKSWCSDPEYAAAAAAADAVLAKLNPDAGEPGTFFRDSYPIRSMLAFWELAEKEVNARGLDTCGDQLGYGLIEAYHRSQVAYCMPDGVHELQVSPIRNGSHWNGEPVPPTTIECAPVHRDEFSKWWPYPASPCLSTNIRAVPDELRKFVAAGCEVTDDGANLFTEMGNEGFLGKEITRSDLEVAECKEVVDHTVVIIGRQDQWNP
jgi:hypothetical protein